MILKNFKIRKYDILTSTILFFKVIKLLVKKWFILLKLYEKKFNMQLLVVFLVHFI